MRTSKTKFAVVAMLCLLLIIHLLAVAGACLLVYNVAGDQSIVICAALVVVTVLIDVGVIRYALDVFKRSEEAYAANVTRELERSLSEYKEQAERDKRVTQSVGAAVEQHIRSAREALASQNIDKMREHVRQCLKIVSAAEPSSCHNVVVASVLQSKARQCAESNVRLVTEVTLPAHLAMDDIEVASLFFGLIDNALMECEELRGSQDPEGTSTEPLSIVVRSNIHAGQIFVEASNPCRAGAGDRRRVALRRADATVTHGLGTVVVSDIAARHGGVVEFTERDDVFHARAMIPLTQ